MKPMTGRLYTIEWNNPYTDPPGGAPRVLVEVFTLGKKPPAEFEQFPHSLGGGYSYTSRHVGPPVKNLPKETLARVRQKRLARRVEKKVPLFAEFFIQQELERKPDYYNGITDAALQQKKDDVSASELERYLDYISRIDQVIVYAPEPTECQERSELLRAEMNAIQERALQKKG
jgi:hypothetical protein